MSDDKSLEDLEAELEKLAKEEAEAKVRRDNRLQERREAEEKQRIEDAEKAKRQQAEKKRAASSKVRAMHKKEVDAINRLADAKSDMRALSFYKRNIGVASTISIAWCILSVFNALVIITIVLAIFLPSIDFFGMKFFLIACLFLIWAAPLVIESYARRNEFDPNVGFFFPFAIWDIDARMAGLKVRIDHLEADSEKIKNEAHALYTIAGHGWWV